MRATAPTLTYAQQRAVKALEAALRTASRADLAIVVHDGQLLALDAALASTTTPDPGTDYAGLVARGAAVPLALAHSTVLPARKERPQ